MHFKLSPEQTDKLFENVLREALPAPERARLIRHFLAVELCDEPETIEPPATLLGALFAAAAEDAVIEFLEKKLGAPEFRAVMYTNAAAIWAALPLDKRESALNEYISTHPSPTKLLQGIE